MDYQNLIERLTSGVDISTESGKKAAYNKCLDYALDNIKSPKEFNSFMAQASELLGQITSRRDVAAETTQLTGDEKLHLAYSDKSGPALTGNKSGLLYLSRLLVNLAESEEPEEHTHLYYDEPPMSGKTFPLTIYLEDDTWFSKYANEALEKVQVPAEKISQRDIEPGTIAAFVVFEKVPSEFPLLSGNIYKVLSNAKYKNQEVWVKGISEQSDRLFVFDFTSDEGTTQKVALDLDDPAVLFLKKSDIEKLK